jgi:UDP-4-amino-4-deoxy-L-arabinose-oxoglutarate aminotransferase
MKGSSVKKTKPDKDIPLFDLRVSAEAKRRVNQVLKSGWLTTGSQTTEFERKVSKMVKVPYAAATNSATAGLKAVLSAMDIGPGQEVITTPYTFVATVEAVLSAGAKPVMADINSATLNIDADEVERQITEHTALIMPVDIAGYPCDYRRLTPLCRQHGLPLVSDAAHAFGATLRGKHIPELTDATVYSFHSTKNVTCGEGGMVVSRSKRLIETVRTLGRHGLSSNAHMRRESKNKGYNAIAVGTKANMSDLHAAVGLGQLQVFETNQRKRARLARQYQQNLAGLDAYLELPFIEDGFEHAWHLFIIRLHLSRLKIDRDRFIDLMARRGIECGVHFRPVFEFELFRDLLGVSADDLPNAAYAGRRVVSLPLYPHLKLAEVDYVCSCIQDICRKHGR